MQKKVVAELSQHLRTALISSPKFRFVQSKQSFCFLLKFSFFVFLGSISLTPSPALAAIGLLLFPQKLINSTTLSSQFDVILFCFGMFTAPGNRVPKKSEAFKLPNWLAKPSTSAAGFGQAALFQPTFSNLTEQTFLAKKPTTTTKINTNKANKPFATNLGDINYFDNLEIVSQTSPHGNYD